MRADLHTWAPPEAILRWNAVAQLAVAETRGQRRRGRVLVTGASGFGLVLFAMIVACIPPEGTPSVALFELTLVGGCLAFVGTGGWFYWRARQRAAGELGASPGL